MTTAILTARGSSIRQITALLYGQARIVIGSQRQTPYGSTAVLVTAPSDIAQAQEDRFGSGLVGARVQDSFEGALAYARDELEVDWSGVADPSGDRILATVQFQYWSNDYAVDAAEPFSLDVTEVIRAMAEGERAALADNRDSSDRLYLDAAEAGFARVHEGPFYVTVASSVEEFFESATA